VKVLFYSKYIIYLDWIGLDWIGLDWIGLDWIGLETNFATIVSTRNLSHP